MLETKNVAKSFGGLRAVDGCSIKVEAGTITGLMGPNGAGKTTLFNVITGFIRRDKGEIWFQGEEVGSLPPHKIARKGLTRTFQTAAGFAGMTVMENMLIATRAQEKEYLWKNLLSGRLVRRMEREALDLAGEILNFMGLYTKKNQYVRDIGSAEVKLLEVGRQMMTESRLLLLDEPMSGVSPVFQEKMVGYIRNIRDTRGYAFFIIEHNLGFLREVSDISYVMNNGQILAHGTWAEITADERVIAAYLGSKK
ncbi:MAG: ABC transporter ATP-binding protein [Thermodesulfobacteriota bacterium]